MRLPCLGLAVLLLAACGADAPEPATSAPPAATDAAAQAPQGEQRRRGERMPRELLERAREGRRGGERWWEAPEIAGPLGLDESQRAAIGAAVDQRQQAVRQAAMAAEEAQLRLREALKAGELEAARRAAEQYADQVREQVLQRHLLPVAVLEPMDADQRERLVQQHPELLAALVRGQRGQRPPRGRAD